MALGDTWEVALQYQANGQNCVNVWHMTENEALPDDNARGVEWETTFTNAYKFAWGFGTDISARLIKARTILTALPAAIERAVAFGGDAGHVGPTEYQQSPICVHLRTAVADRHGRGRKFISGYPANWVENGVLNATGLGQMGAFCNTLMTRWAGVLGGAGRGPFTLVVVSRADPGRVPPWAGRVSDVVSMSAAAAIGTMRSRKVGVGS